ncbi:WhiB family transcriptional regulator [Actinosynnema sp. CA-248983]
MTEFEGGEFADRVAAELDECAALADEELVHAVRVHGLCGWLATDVGQAPEWSGRGRADREAVAAVCGGCPVQRECLEWEFRTAGHAMTGGVWGPLDAGDRRAVFVAWSDRRDGGHSAGDRR